MRTLAVCAVAAAGLLAWCPTAGARPWEPDVGGAVAWAAKRQGSVSFAVRTPARRYGVRVWRTAPTASVLKAMLLVAYLRRASVRSRPLRRADRRLLEPMVRRSDDVAATRVKDLVGNRALRRLARRAGMRRFSTHPVWGLSRFCAADGARLMLRVDRLTPDGHRAYALRLLGSLARSQRWGIARVRPRGWALFFKGGWGSGSGAVDHQVALLRRGRRRLSVAILTTGSPSHAYAKDTLRGVAARLLKGLRPDSTLADAASG
jgi:hypothetical protein